MAENTELMTVDNICNRVYVIRGQQVMLDYDLAEIYGYEVKRLNEQVKNNISRFPEDFMFRLTKQEVEYLRSDFSTANMNPKSRALPHAFTEQGIYMLATVLRGELAEQQSIFIMRAFREMRHYIKQNQQFVTQSEMRLVTAKVSEMSVQMATISDRQHKTEQNVEVIQKSIDTLNENFVSDEDFKNFVIYKGQKFEADAAYIDDMSGLHIYGVLKRYIISHIKYSHFYKNYIGINNVKKVGTIDIGVSEYRNKPINKKYIYNAIMTRYKNGWKISCSENSLSAIVQCVKKLKVTDDIDYYLANLKVDGCITRKMLRMIWDRPNEGETVKKSEVEYIYLEELNKYVAKLEGEVISYCKVSDIYEDFGNIVVFTEEEYRRQGLAETLLVLLLQKCKEKEIYPMYVVDSTNLKSIKLAKKMGFSIVSEEIVISIKNKED